MRQNKLVFLMLMLLLVLGLTLALTACGDDDSSDDGTNTDPTPTAETLAGPAGVDTSLNVDGPSVSGPGGSDDESQPSNGLDTMLPGCDDLDSDECPAPLDPSLIPLDGEASSGGVTMAYPSRYSDAATSNEGVLITITPSEKNKFELKGTFEVYFAESVEAALAALDDLTGDVDHADWSTDTLTGTIGVVNHDPQDPPLTTVIGAFTLNDAPDDGRVIVLKATTTGTFGWYFHTKVFEAMLESLVVE